MRTYCINLNINNVEKKVYLCGWIKDIRILKNIFFINLKDNTGFVQIFSLKKYKNIWKIAKSLTKESCIGINGIIKKRSKKNINNKIKNGLIEIFIYNLEIFNYSSILPLNINNNNNNNEKTIMKYRYLYLRNEYMYNIFYIRSKVKNLVHNFLQKKNFIEIETPYLSKSMPEGAQDFFVYSIKNKNKTYALPQSPQIFKQLLMISGMDKYYQIVKCFRDENLRSDRQHEFTQIDIEISFSNFINISNLIEKMIYYILKKIKKIKINIPFKKINYKDSINFYGTDKPDLRNPLKFIDLSKFFKNINKKYKKIICLNLKLNNKNFDFNYIYKYIKNYNVYNCFFFKIKKKLKNKFYFENNLNLKKYNNDILQKICKYLKLKEKYLIFILFFKKINNKNLIKIRKFFCKNFNLYLKNKYFPVWIVNFPMFFYNKKKILESYHHPFTMPINIKKNSIKNINDYTKIISSSYDLVINGYELGSGSIRINNINLQNEIFDLLKINKKKYNFFLEALKYGTPPHIGLALGLDRLIMLITGEKNIRNVIAFPKTTSGNCPLTGAPD